MSRPRKPNTTTDSPATDTPEAEDPMGDVPRFSPNPQGQMIRSVAGIWMRQGDVHRALTGETK